MNEVTRILNQIADGSGNAADELLSVVYDELKAMAAAKVRHEQSQNSIVATDLVHEAYLRLAGNLSFESRRHFFGAAAEAMRRILVDRARRRHALKRGGNANRIELQHEMLSDDKTDHRLAELDDALDRFAQVQPEKAELVKLRYFAGLKIHEAAELLNISTATADRHWAYAKAWLKAEIE